MLPPNAPWPDKAQRLISGLLKSNLAFQRKLKIEYLRCKFMHFVMAQPKLSARWRSGYAAACKAVNTGSIPVRASKYADPA